MQITQIRKQNKKQKTTIHDRHQHTTCQLMKRLRQSGRHKRPIRKHDVTMQKLNT